MKLKKSHTEQGVNMNIKNSERKNTITAFVLLAILSVVPATSFSGPALSFRYDHIDLSQSQCVQRGVKTLIQEELLKPSNTYNINDTSFIIGENEELTAIIDCSEVPQSGRVTIMVSHSDLSSSKYWANYLLNKIR